MMRIDLLGVSFQIQSDEDPEYVEEILGYYRARIREIEESVATGDPLKKAILAALLVTDELFRCRGNQGESTVTGEVEAITRRLLERIDDALDH
ncbi:MAG: cell division protein ZapA [Spirochaetaceae bacterium]|nr:MAG: cell division protein ZapA [Spirochaetaceae bacterium]